MICFKRVLYNIRKYNEFGKYRNLLWPVANAILTKAAKVKLLICDVDGVMSDGLIYMGNNGEELKAFNVRDGYGIRCLLTSNIEVAIITGRKAKLLEDRAQTLGITYLYQGQSDKLLAYQQLLDTLQLSDEQIAYIGDDLIDCTSYGKSRLICRRSGCTSVVTAKS